MVFLLLAAAGRRSGHARAFRVVGVVIVYLLRAVLADLHEEGVELRHHERDPDSEACVRHYRAGVASMAWGWTRCEIDCRAPAARRDKVNARDFFVRSARAGRRVGDGTNATRVLITESVNSPSTRRPREAAAAARSMCGVRGAAFLLVGRLL